MMLSYTHYTDNIPEGFGGVNYGPYTRIRLKYKDDSGIHAHENLHARQWWAFMLTGILASILLYPQGQYLWYYALLLGFGTHGILYKFFHAYRLWCEVQAYRKQLGYYAEDRRMKFAKFISTKYKLNISVEEALKLLKD